ncbi:hypothetical protein [Streptomyces sp. GQFP]|uniref:hypothetical protein n=1 Tax=Streptomyces sp. GQFP TaxID=2907545 RepID=UPI001F46DFEC|nr:hypothetical protein [Streptomyces sp. GQFP]UIX33264.1 hypothetical protein LUX31_26440 [Streptomyces sp. GQFP]
MITRRPGSPRHIASRTPHPATEQTAPDPSPSPPPPWLLLVLAFAAATLLATSSYLWVDWGTPEERTQYGTVSLTVAGVLLGMLVNVFLQLPVKSLTAHILALALMCTAGGLVIAYIKNHQPIDVTDKVVLGERGQTVEVHPDDVFDLSVPLPEERDRLELTLSGRDLDPGNGSDCLPGSKLHLTGDGLPRDGKSVRLGKVTKVSISQVHGTVRLEAKLTADPECRILINPSHAVIDS